MLFSFAALTSPVPLYSPPSQSAQSLSCPRTRTLASLRRSLLPHTHPNLPTHASPHYFPSARHPSLSLFSLTWSHPHPLATLLISPGLQWHSAWFNILAITLRAARITVIALDALSAGRSDRLEGKRGLIYTLDDHVDELEALVRRVQTGSGSGNKVFVLGESSGGLTAAVMAMRENVNVDGYILCAPALRVQRELLPPPVVVEMVIRMGRVMPAMVVPGESVGGETWGMAFGCARCRELSMRDGAVGYGDPVYFGSAAAFLGGMRDLESELRRGKVRVGNVLVLQGGKDVRTDGDAAKQFVQRVKCSGVRRLVEVKQGRHQLFQDKREITERIIWEVRDFILECV